MSDSITFKYKPVKIRKDRNCVSCYRKFASGSKMIYWAGLTEGDFGYVYLCPTCDEIYQKQQPDYDYAPFDSYLIEVRDNKEQTPEQLLDKLKG